MNRSASIETAAEFQADQILVNCAYKSARMRFRVGEEHWNEESLTSIYRAARVFQSACPDLDTSRVQAWPKRFFQVTAEADDVVCLLTPPLFHAVSVRYTEFPETNDEEVQSLVEAATGNARSAKKGRKQSLAKTASGRKQPGVLEPDEQRA